MRESVDVVVMGPLAVGVNSSCYEISLVMDSLTHQHHFLPTLTMGTYSSIQGNSLPFRKTSQKRQIVKPWSMSESNRPPSRIKVPQKKKKKDLDLGLVNKHKL